MVAERERASANRDLERLWRAGREREFVKHREGALGIRHLDNASVGSLTQTIVWEETARLLKQKVVGMSLLPTPFFNWLKF